MSAPPNHTALRPSRVANEYAVKAREQVTCFTSFSFSYLAKARLLASSVKRFHPDWHLIAVITDTPPPGLAFNLSEENFDEIVWSSSLNVPDFQSWLFQHNVIEACTAVKAVVLKQLVDSGHSKVIYLDPDIAVFNSLQPVVELLDQHDIVLTPHQLTPDTDAIAIIDNEIGSLKYGIFNLGFLAIRGDGEGKRFAGWWHDRLMAHCFDDIPAGLFTDQRWCDHVPVFFERVMVLKDAGYNVASWNLSQRAITLYKDEQLLVNGVPLRFFHFTKLGPIGDAMTARYAQGNIVIHELWAWYRRTLQKFVTPQIPENWWAYGHYSSGAAIQPAHRKLYRQRVDLRKAFTDPFDASSGGYEQWLQSAAHTR